jgi:hypothetical protein
MIGNRMFFGGNLLRQPVFVQLKKNQRQNQEMGNFEILKL